MMYVNANEHAHGGLKLVHKHNDVKPFRARFISLKLNVLIKEVQDRDSIVLD